METSSFQAQTDSSTCRRTAEAASSHEAHRCPWMSAGLKTAGDLRFLINYNVVMESRHFIYERKALTDRERRTDGSRAGVSDEEFLAARYDQQKDRYVFRDPPEKGSRFWNLQRMMNLAHSDDMIEVRSLFDLGDTIGGAESAYLDILKNGMHVRFKEQPILNTEYFLTAMQDPKLTARQFLTGEECFLFRLIHYEANAEEERKEKFETRKMAAIKGYQEAEKAGRTIGRKFPPEKEREIMTEIFGHSRHFNGTETDAEVQKRLGISKPTYIKYKKRILAEIEKTDKK